MTGLAVDIKVREAVEAVQGAFEEFGERAFARAVQYTEHRFNFCYFPCKKDMGRYEQIT